MIVVLFISLGTFYFSNYIIPKATLKWKALIYDIQETKISKIINPGSYSNELEGLAIKVKEEPACSKAAQKKITKNATI